MTSSKIAIGILSFEHPDITARAVRSAVAAADDVPVFLLHNGSSEANERRLQGEFSKIIHLSLQTNAGYSGGSNFLLSSLFARGFKWVLFLTNDCELKTLGPAPTERGLYAPLIYRRSIEKIDSIGATFQPWAGRLRHLRNETIARAYATKKSRRLHPTLFYVPGTAFWIDRSTWQTLGGFDESLHTYWEDVDLSTRAHQLGASVGIHPATTLIHSVGKTCHKRPFYTRYLFQRNRRTVSRRYSPKWLKPLQSIWL